MADDDPLRRTFTNLRTVAVVGPRLATEDPRPMWRVFAGAPKYGLNKEKKFGVTADNVHSLRLAAADAPDKDKWRNPRLIDLHLSIGSAATAADHNYASAAETLEIAAGPDRTPIKSEMGALFHAGAEAGDLRKQARFVHVICEPLTPSGKDGKPAIWPRDDSDEKLIETPTMRLVAGRILLHVKLVDNAGRATPFAWLRDLRIVTRVPQGSKEKWGDLYLTPDGIEFDAKLPFPKKNDALRGRVLLTCASTGGKPAFAVTLLKPEKPDLWLTAWGSITPAGAEEKALTGFLFKADCSVVPAFRWSLAQLKSGREVEAPGDAVMMVLLPPPAASGDGSARLQLDRVIISESGGNVEFKAAAGQTDSADMLKLDCVSADATFEPSKPIALDVDDDRLAADLRRAYGLSQPQLVKGADETLAASPNPPLLSAFTPLADGWLQFHTPNLPPIDTNRDVNLEALPSAAKDENVLDGYFRLRAGQPSAETMSAFIPEIQPRAEPPLELTIARATGVKATLSVDVSAAKPTPKRAHVELYGAALETRGLLFVSAARPSALEALPRLAAGPGLVIPMSMHGTTGAPAANSILGATLKNFKVTASQSAMTLENAEFTVAFDGGRARWREIAAQEKCRDALRKARKVVLGETTDPREEIGKALAAAAAVEQADLVVRDAKERLAEAQTRHGRIKAQKDDIEAQRKQLGATTNPHIAINELVRKELDDAWATAEDKHVSADAELHKAAKVLGNANTSLAAEVEKFTKAMKTLLAKAGPPLPAVAWLRHPTTPLAAAMPMTRAACGAVVPMETRGLIPYRLKSKPSPDRATRFEVADLKRSGNDSLPILEVRERARIAGWPWAVGDFEGRPERGVAFAAVGAPGLEARPAEGESAAPTWEIAYRYDLPTLDEAFATASLPPAHDDDAKKPAEARPAAEQMVPTALDWGALGGFWAEQERKLQNARVVSSHLTKFVKEDKVFGDDVTNLIEGVAWPIKATMKLGAATEDLPFGRTVIDDGGTPPLAELQGVAALKGATRNYEVKNGKLEPRGDDAKGEGIVSVVGFAPSTYAKEGFHLDNRRSGAIAPIPGAVQRRELRLGDEKRWTASLEKPVEATINGAKFRFWFKDALFKDETFVTQREDIDFDVWRDSEKLAAAGFEWRFFAENFDGALIQGRDVIPFFGFDLEPLRLVELKIDALATAPTFKSAKILCRLFLGPVEDAPDCGVNLVFLSIGANAGALSAKIEQVGELRYILDCTAKSTSRSLDAKVKLGGAAGAFAPVIEKLYMRAGGAWINFKDNAKIELLRAPEASQVTIAYEESAAAPPSQRGTLAISAFKANIGRERNDIALRRRIRIASPDSPAGKPVVEIEEAFGGLAASAKIFGVDAALSGGDVVIDEGDGAVTLTLSKADVKLGEAKFIASLALAGRVAESAVVGTLELAAFHAAVDLVQVPGEAKILPGVTLEKGRARILAAASPDLAVDKAALARANTATFSGVVTAESAISWPAVVAKSPEDSEIPFPNNAPSRHGGSWVASKPGGATARHKATWTFRDHRAPVGLVAALAASDKDAVFTAFVTARHELTRPSSRTLAWSSVETLAIGTPCALVPPLDIETFASDDSTTFAPRYNNVAKDGQYQQNVGGVAVVAAGMKRPGRGAVATVLQGALGAAFRASFESEKREEKLLLAGGFLGLLALSDDDRPRPLLRLPILAGLKRTGESLPIAQSLLVSKEWRIAWADGPAAQLVSMSRPTAPQPASAHADSVAAAVAAGSDEMWRRLDIGAADPVGALLVEQSFPDQEFPAKIKKKEDIPLYGKLDEAPFFLASAVAVTRVLDDKFDENTPVSALALCAGYVDVDSDLGRRRRPLAAALSLAATDAQSAAPNEPERARLIVVGTKVVSADWRGPTKPTDDESLLGSSIARMTLAFDSKPVAALVVAPPRRASDPVRFVAWTAQESGFERTKDLVSDALQFPDIGRGRMHPPSADDTVNSLFAAPPLEGPARPVRDEASGVAGLGRRVALPLQAGEAGGAEKPPRPIWLTQNRVPVYLPLQTTDLRGPPVGWLAPASAKVRLPTDGAMRDALYRPDDSRKPHRPNDPKKPCLQPFLPADVDAAEIGERAGVATVRRARLLSAVALNWPNGGGSLVKAFDPDFARFGLPAQAGSSFVRALRTPRPGPLPKNTGDPSRDRRTQASYLRPNSPIDAYFGSADVIGGAHDALGRWSIVAVAMPDSRGLFSERWDGTVKVVCSIEIETKGRNSTEKPMNVLSRLLLPQTGPSALLRIGDAALPMERLIWGEKSDASFTPESGRLAAKVELIFEPADKTSALTHKPHPVIAAALANAALPPSASLQWLAFPSNRRGDGAPTDKPLKLGAPGALAVGDDLAPVALRFPLYPVAPSCGALPLAPATVLFGDPAYDRDLAGQPVVDEDTLREGKVLNAATDRGRLRLSLYADRLQVNRSDSVALMLDLRYERPLSDSAQTVADADANGSCSGGDLLGGANQQPNATLGFKVKPREGAERELWLGAEAKLPAAKIGVFALAALRETDGAPARLAPGDMLEIKAEVGANAEFQVWDAEKAKGGGLTLLETTKRVLRLTMTAEATTPPPPALYVALLRTQEKGSIATALHAQSPTPWRVDIAEPLRGFRHGLLRRRANFVWTLMRPEGEFVPHPSLAVVKQDRNGQTWQPEKADDFVTPT